MKKVEIKNYTTAEIYSYPYNENMSDFGNANDCLGRAIHNGYIAKNDNYDINIVEA